MSANKMQTHVCRYLGQRQLYDHREEVDDTESETMVSLLRYFACLLLFVSGIKVPWR